MDELSTSKIGSLHGLRRGSGAAPRRRVLLSAHMDAIGLIATSVVDGMIHFTQIGGIDPRILPGQPVTIYGRSELPGVVVQPPDRLLPESQAGKPVAMEHLLVDTGLTAAETARLVRPGDPIAFAQPPFELAGETLAGHSLDNRASVAAVTLCLQELQHSVAAWDVWAVATVQEETVLGGAFTSPFDIRPDLAIAIDVTHAKGAGASDYRSLTLGGGPVLGWGPNIHTPAYRALERAGRPAGNPHPDGANAAPFGHRCHRHPGGGRRHSHPGDQHPAALHAHPGRDDCPQRHQPHGPPAGRICCQPGT